MQELGKHAAQLGGKAMLVCGAHSLQASGQLDRALGLLWGAGVKTMVYDAILGEPTLDMVQNLEVMAILDAGVRSAASGKLELVNDAAWCIG